MASNNGYHPEIKIDHINPENLGHVQSLLSSEAHALRAQGLTRKEAYNMAGATVADVLGINPDSFWQELGRALADIRRARKGLPVLLPGSEMFEEITPAPATKASRPLLRGKAKSPVAKVEKVAPPPAPASPIARVEKVQTEPVFAPVLGAVVEALEKANLKKPGQGIKVTFVTERQAESAQKSSNIASQRLGYQIKAQCSKDEPLTVTFIRK